MKYRKILTAVTLALVLFSCKKDKVKPIDPPPPAQSVLLKDIVHAGLPSPYYHFEYNGEGKVSKASFSSGIRLYDVIYSGGKISEIQNNNIVNRDRLQYLYDDQGRVELIKYVNQAGVTYRFCSLTYQDGKLRLMEWERKVDAGFIMERTLSFVYQADNNLLEMTDHYHATPGQTEETYVTRFEQYDNKVNTDGFSLIHKGTDHLLLLPHVELQKNNARKLIFSAIDNSYTIDYTYTYNDRNAPITKHGEVLYTSGPNTGQRFQTNATFTYYP